MIRVFSRGRGSLMALALVAGSATLASTGPATAATQTLYVVNFHTNNVSVINTATNKVVRTISVGTEPNGIVVTPDGSTAYVVNSTGGTVTPINTSTNRAGKAIKVGRGPAAIAVTPNSRWAYVANSRSNTVTPIHVATNTPGKPIPVGKGPYNLAITPNGATVYVASLEAGTVTPIDNASKTAGTPIKVGRSPSQIAITPNGRAAYVVSGYIYATTIKRISVATNKVTNSIKVGAYPHEIVITPDGKKAYVACFDINVPNGQLGLGQVTPIDLATNTAEPPISFGNEFPNQFAIAPDGKTLYVTSGSGVTPIDVATDRASRLIRIGSNPWAITINSAGTTAYVTDIGGTNTPGSTVTPINLSTGTAGRNIKVGVEPIALAFASPVSVTSTSAKAFVMPGHNIACLYDSGKIRCDIYSGLKPEPTQPCKYFWKGVSLTGSGRTQYLCIIDTIYVPNAPVLRYGSRWSRGSIACASRPDGLRCRNDVHHGFFLSRSVSRTW